LISQQKFHALHLSVMQNTLPKKYLSRRIFLKLLGISAALGITGCAGNKGFFGGSGLSALAATRNCLYGAAVQSSQLEDAAFARALAGEAALLVPENELKWIHVQPRKDVFDFSGYQKIAAFAQANNMSMRGHVLVWHHANPNWVKPALKNRRAAEHILTTHIQRVVKETSALITDWDVVNEAVHPYSPRGDGLRNSMWLRALGPEYIPLAFHAAHEAAPNLTLTYNDYGAEYSDTRGIKRRRFILKLLEKLKRNNVPVHALGLQSHLQAGRPLGGQEFTRFLSEVRSMGLAVTVTELDMDVNLLHGTMNEKIAHAQLYLRVYLNMVQEGGTVPKLLTWGLSDRYSWMKKYVPELAGMLPLDANFQRGLFWETLSGMWA
jgi:endo-1,4-beta-xylanase